MIYFVIVFVIVRVIVLVLVLVVVLVIVLVAVIIIVASARRTALAARASTTRATPQLHVRYGVSH